jgi:asparagine synthase (glutamine-hydrolysing)
MTPEFRARAAPVDPPRSSTAALRDLQLRDVLWTKLPRALRFNDRVSMRASTELREPFLDHRLVELAMRQPAERKVRGKTGKWLLRRIASDLVPEGITEAPKRPVQTPQREWLRGPLCDWATAQIERALSAVGGSWLDGPAVRRELANYLGGRGDNSYFVWQWVSLGLLSTPPAGANER